MKRNCLTAILLPPLLLIANGFGQESAPANSSFSLASSATTSERSVIDFRMAAIRDDDVVSLQDTDDWRFACMGQIWLMGMVGDLGARGQTTRVSASFVDIVEDSDSLFSFSGRLEIGKGRWGGYVEGSYSRLGVDGVSGSVDSGDIDVSFDLSFLDFGLMYTVGEWAPTGAAAGNRLNTTLDLYAGGRYTNVRLKLDPDLAPSRSKRRGWVDPIVGARVILPVAESWHLLANADIGGFGAGSDFAWSATALFGYEFTLFKMPANFYMGYRVLGQDYSRGSGDDKFTWDVIMHGPLLGLSLHF